MIVFLFVLLIVPLSVHADTALQDRILSDYHNVRANIEQCGIKRPLSSELARWGVLRQLLEDGNQRKPDVSIPGLCAWGWNNDVTGFVLSKMGGSHIVDSIPDGEGNKMIRIQGPRADLMGATTVALLFDRYVTLFPDKFTPTQRFAWTQAKYNPNHVDISTFRECRTVAKKCNRIFGPQAEVVERNLDSLRDVFEYLEVR
ncbi:MAG: hypothetical protein V2B18_15685 [Pseudomonadota bacterium]